jgi:hypothetical protein
MTTNKKYLKAIIVGIVFIVMSVLTYKDAFNRYPTGIHEWSQSDHYALALNYAERGLNFFLPHTYQICPLQTPPKYPLDTLEGICACASPLSEYIAGCVMAVTGCKEPIAYKLPMLLITLSGLFFLWLLMQKEVESFLQSLLLPIFIFSLPVFLYYQCNFSPTPPAAALCFIGYYYYFTYLRQQKFKYFLTACIFFFLALLFRTPFAVILIAVICQQILSYIINKKIVWKELSVFAGLIVLETGYIFYHIYLQNRYGSVFNFSFLPPNSWESFQDIMSVVWNRKLMFLQPSEILLLLLAVNALAYTIYARFKHIKLLSYLQKQFLLQGSILFIGAVLYSFLMMKQFYYHDYYYLDTFLLPVTLFVAFLISMIKWKNKWLFYGIIAILYFVLSWNFKESYIHVQRTKVEFWEEDPLYQRVFILSDMKHLIEKNHIGTDEVINFPDPIFPFNIAQVNLRRRGYWDKSGFEPSIVTSPLHQLSINTCDYMLITEKYLDEEYKQTHPEFDHQLIYVDKYETTVLFKYIKNEQTN